LPVKALAPAVLFDHHVRDLVDPLVRGKALLALQALAPPANAFAFLRLARVHHFIVFVTAERALHIALGRGILSANAHGFCASVCSAARSLSRLSSEMRRNEMCS